MNFKDIIEAGVIKFCGNKEAKQIKANARQNLENKDWLAFANRVYAVSREEDVNSEVNANDEVGVISDDDVSAKTDEMSEDAIRVFNAVREGVEKSNADRKANLPDYVGIVEATSPEGLELFGLAEIIFKDEEASVKVIGDKAFSGCAKGQRKSV